MYNFAIWSDRPVLTTIFFPQKRATPIRYLSKPLPIAKSSFKSNFITYLLLHLNFLIPKKENTTAYTIVINKAIKVLLFQVDGVMLADKIFFTVP